MGFLLGIISALGASAQNTLYRGLKDEDPFLISWFRFLIALPVVGLMVTFFSELAVPSFLFWVLLLGISLPIELGIVFLNIRAFQESPQSLIGPLFSLSPLFLVPLGYFFLKEVPSMMGFVGVISVIIGPFFLGKKKERESLKKRAQNILEERGSWFILGAAFFAAGGVILTKMLFRYAPPLLVTFYGIVALIFGITIILFLKGGFSHFTWPRPSFLGVGALFSMVAVTHTIGLSLLPAAYFISLKRLSLVFDVVLGRVIHHEDHFRERMTGALFMIAGVILIAFG